MCLRSHGIGFGDIVHSIFGLGSTYLAKALRTAEPRHPVSFRKAWFFVAACFKRFSGRCGWGLWGLDLWIQDFRLALLTQGR